MSLAATDPATTGNHHGNDVAVSKPAAPYHEPEDALLRAIDHFRTSFMTHVSDLITPLYVQHMNTKHSGYASEHPRDHSHSRHYDSHIEGRVYPLMDMRETKTDYFADVEMPGVENKDNIMVQWTSPRTLLIDTMISRPQVRDWDSDPESAMAGLGDDKGFDEEVTWISSERRIGRLTRVLMFATDVDMKALKAQLVAGLLKIKVPKRLSGFEGWKVQVE